MSQRRIRFRFNAQHILQRRVDLQITHWHHRFSHWMWWNRRWCRHRGIIQLSAFGHQLATVFVIHKGIFSIWLPAMMSFFLVMLVTLFAILFLLLFLGLFVLFSMLRRWLEQRWRLLRMMNVVWWIAGPVFWSSIYFQDELEARRTIWKEEVISVIK